jgi:SAM-dependent methyltransferase
VFVQRRRRAQVDRSILVRLFGYRAALLHGPCTTFDRWRFIKRHCPRTRNGERVFEVGCGTGAFSIGLAKRGYHVTGLSWDERNQRVAAERARIVGVTTTDFPVGDARELDTIPGHTARYDYVLSLENIEHIVDDRKLMRDLAACLKPGGWLILSTPNKDYRAITPSDEGPFVPIENGGHVRRGYTTAMLRELCADSGLEVEQTSSCSGFFSQKLNWVFRRLGWFGWLLVLPLRPLPLLFDRAIGRIFGYPDLSITLVAYKPRFG